MQPDRAWWHDWRAWAFAAAAVIVAVLDVANQLDIVLVSFLVVPIVGSAVLASPVFTVLLTGLSMVLSVVSGVVGDYPPSDMWRRAAVLALSGIVAMVLAREVERARSELTRQRSQYQLLAEHASDIVYRSDADRLMTWVSPAVTTALGWRPDELVGTVMADLIHPDDRSTTEQVRDRAYAGESVDDPAEGYVLRLRRKSGGYRWMSNRLTPLSDDRGAPAGIVGGLTAVDELVAVRERAESGEARLRATLDSLLDPHLMLRAARSADGRIADLLCSEPNAAACHGLDRTRDELDGASVSTFRSPFGLSALQEMLADSVETGEPIVLDDYAFDADAPTSGHRYDIRGIRVAESLSLTWRDVTDRYAAAEALARSERTYRLLADNSSDVVLHVRDVTVAWVSPSLTPTLGWLPEEWIDHEITGFWHPDDLAAMESARGVIEMGTPAVLRARVEARDGVFHWLEFHAQQFMGQDGEPDGISASFRVIDAEVENERELERRARFDDLTGVLKRGGALDRLNEVGRGARRPGDETAVLFIDVDEFKHVNDTWGHAAGDAVLLALTRRIKDSIRGGDAVARMGGDEFLVILEGVHDVDEAATVAEKIRVAGSRPVPTRDGEVTVSVSVGVTLAVPSESADALIARADEAMYEAKARGRNVVTVVPVPERPTVEDADGVESAVVVELHREVEVGALHQGLHGLQVVAALAGDAQFVAHDLAS